MCKNKNLQYESTIRLFDDSNYAKKVMKSCKTYQQLNNADKFWWILQERYRNRVSTSTLNLVLDELVEVYTTMSYKVD